MNVQRARHNTITARDKVALEKGRMVTPMTLKHIAFTFLLVAGLAPTPAHAEPADVGSGSSRTPTTTMPVVAEHYYRMLAKVRPLLFWISRDNVGGARIGWLGDRSGSKGYELLIGSDPARAPRKINRWGYIAEEMRGSRASTLGVMKQSNEESIEDAKATLGKEVHGASHVFKAIRATAANGQAISDVLTLQAQGDLTYHDVGALLSQLNNGARNTSTRRVTLPAGTRPGFLIALADLIDTPSLTSVPYVYNGRFHTLHRKSSNQVAMRAVGRDYTGLVRDRFETENQATRERTSFEITYARDGALRGVPIHATYRPKWWFQVELFLEDEPAKF